MKTKVNLNTNEKINVSDLNDTHLIGMEYINVCRERGRIRKIHSGLYFAVSTLSFERRNDAYNHLTTGISIQNLIQRFKEDWDLKAVYVFDAPKELKKWLKA